MRRLLFLVAVACVLAMPLVALLCSDARPAEKDLWRFEAPHPAGAWYQEEHQLGELSPGRVYYRFRVQTCAGEGTDCGVWSEWSEPEIIYLPEPSGLVLLGAGVGKLAILRRSKIRAR